MASSADEEAVDPTTLVASLLSERQRAELLSLIEAEDWASVAVQIGTYRDDELNLEALVAEAEEAALVHIRPLPFSNPDANLAGYLALAALRPESEGYATKVEQYRAAVEGRREALVGKLNVETDRISGTTWYTHPTKPRFVDDRSTVWLYIGRKGDGRPTLRLRTNYTNDSWLFVHSVLAFHDGVTEPLTSGYFERDHDTEIWEWLDEIPSEYQIGLLRDLSEADEAILRFEGAQYHDDATLSQRDKDAIRDVLDAYEIMRGE